MSLVNKVSYIVIFVTASKKTEATRIANTLLKEKLVACVNIISRIDSLFWWKAKIDKSKETLLVIKTKSSLLKKVIKLVKEIHSYEVPEIIALPIIGGSQDYLKWVEGVTRKNKMHR